MGVLSVRRPRHVVDYPADPSVAWNTLGRGVAETRACIARLLVLIAVETSCDQVIAVEDEYESCGA